MKAIAYFDQLSHMPQSRLIMNTKIDQDHRCAHKIDVRTISTRLAQMHNVLMAFDDDGHCCKLVPDPSCHTADGYLHDRSWDSS